ncbi:hypothetical protein RWE15_15570 [Virgibacillus halophilus]|uniref:Nicotinamidase-related amidase n=2 Tax=Tigheibacillus halophilus TaxID=361280 RepID=A0ABU5C8G7_9BACI|nr:hypothetical protein [Virgibacillus halophilus]
MTKEFEKDKSTDVLVVLDACNRGKQNWLQFDAAAELSAALLEAFEKKSSKATFLSVHDKVEHFSIAEGRRAQLDRVYQHLAAVEPVPALFPAVLLQELNKMPTGFVAYILTASLDEMLFDVLRKMNMHSHGIHILLISAAAELADSDRMLVRHMAKQGITVTSLTKKQLAADPIEVNVF